MVALLEKEIVIIVLLSQYCISYRGGYENTCLLKLMFIKILFENNIYVLFHGAFVDDVLVKFPS